MSLTAVVIDRMTTESCSGAVSVLTVPFGGSSFLDRAAECVRGVSEDGAVEWLVVAPPEFGGDYVERVAGVTDQPFKVLSRVALAAELDGREPADSVVLMDAGRWPLEEFDFGEILQRIGAYQAVTHLIAVAESDQGTHESVANDEAGRVVGVRRHYHKISLPAVASNGIFLSYMPALTVGRTEFESLADLRTTLASRGEFSRDVPLDFTATDLTRVEGIRNLNEVMIAQHVKLGGFNGFRRNGSEVLKGDSCRIDPTARLVGSVILHDGVSIGRDVTIVGPAVLGSNCSVGSRAIIAQSVLAPGTVVAEGTAIHHTVVAGRCSGNGAPPATSCPIRLTVGARPKPLRAPGHAPASQPPASRRSVDRMLKRAFDFTTSLCGLILLAPVLLVVSILIKLDSPGPVFFGHRREQRGGKEFTCLKFRTMAANAHSLQRQMYKENAVDGPQFKIEKDPRVTRVGRWLRATNLDELPQLFNVLAGQMSLVGPRPSPFRENQICLPWRKARLSVPQGITGLWQLCRSDDRSQGDFHEWIYYDMQYVRSFTFWLDLKILLATVVTLGGRRRVPVSWLIAGATDHANESERPFAA